MAITQIQPQQQQRSNGGILGTLGQLAALGGTVFGLPWLTTLGTVASGADTLMNSGNTAMGNIPAVKETGSGIRDFLDQVRQWKNPTDGNVAQTAAQQANKEVEQQLQAAGQNAGTQMFMPSWNVYGRQALGNYGRW